MNIAILASVGAQNLGDELILKNEVKLLEQEFLNSSFRVFTYDVKHSFFVQENVKYLEYFPIDSRKFKNMFRNIKNFCAFLGTLIWSDVVVIGGGGIIYDSEIQSVKNPLDQWIFRAKCARLFRKKLYFYALGIDIKQQENTKKLELIFKDAWKVTVRDIKSGEQLKKIGIESEIVDDPVMSENIYTTHKTPLSVPSHAKPHPNPLLKGEGTSYNLQPHLLLEEKNCDEVLGGEELGGGVSQRESFKRGNILAIHPSRGFSLKEFEKYELSGKKVGLALRSGYFGKFQDVRMEKLLVEELCTYLEKRGSKIIFLPHSFHPTDLQANDYEFMKQFLKPGRKICESMQEVYEWYKESLQPLSVRMKGEDSGEDYKRKLIISMRLHSIILSYVYGIDQIVLSYSQKTEELLKKLEK